MPAALHAVFSDQVRGLRCDKEEARRFLEFLDPTATCFTFATFWDPREPKEPPVGTVVAQSRTGTLDELFDWMVDQNHLGAGVFVTVNETDGNGRKKANIVRVRAVWQEADRGDEPELPVKPHIVVQSSPGKHHQYVLVRDAILEEFESVQQRLVDDYGSDPNAKDRCRVLRLPGFYHMKNPETPHLVRVISASGTEPLAWAELKELFPPVVRPERTAALASGPLAIDGPSLLNPAKVASALEHLDSDMPYQEWLQVGMALHSADPGPDGLALWEAWSARGSLYRPGEPEYRWSTFDAERVGGVTLGTLFWMAREAGWSGSYGNSEWVQGFVPDERERKVAEFNRHHGMVMIEGKDVVVYRELDENVGRFVTRLSSVTAMKNYCREQTVPGMQGAAVRRTPLFEAWMQWEQRRKYSQMVFRPVPGLVAGELGLPDENVLNLYQGLAIQPNEGDCSKMLAHIREIWCNGDSELYDYVIGWLARLFQMPDEQGHTVLLLQSGQGTGKNIIIDQLVRAFGDHAVVCVKPEDLTGKFNEHLATSVLVFANEAIWGGDKRQEGSLKSLVTDEELLVERKFIPKYRVRNRTHLIMASNSDWPAPIDPDDRRFVVLEVSEARKGDQSYFNELHQEIANGGTEALLWHLLHHDISGFNPRTLPVSGPQGTKLATKIRSFDSVEQWWFDCLESGGVNDTEYKGGHFVVKEEDWSAGPVTVPVDAVYESYAFTAKSGRQYLHGKPLFGMKLKRLLGGTLLKTKKALGRDPSGNREHCYVLPSLKDCRLQMEQRLGQPGPWCDGDDSEDGVAF